MKFISLLVFNCSTFFPKEKYTNWIHFKSDSYEYFRLILIRRRIYLSFTCAKPFLFFLEVALPAWFEIDSVSRKRITTLNKFVPLWKPFQERHIKARRWNRLITKFITDTSSWNNSRGVGTTRSKGVGIDVELKGDAQQRGILRLSTWPFLTTRLAPILILPCIASTYIYSTCAEYTIHTYKEGGWSFVKIISVLRWI